MPPKSKKKKSRGGDEQESRWERSPDPPESWDSDKDWEVGNIVDMHIDIMDPRKRSYKITWPGWRREDGTNTTWMPAEDCLEQFPTLVKAFERKLETGRFKLPAPPPSHATSLLHIDEVALGMYNVAPRRRVPPGGAAAARSTASQRQTATTSGRANDRAQAKKTAAPTSAASSKRKRSPLFGDTDESDEDELDILPPSKPSSNRNSASASRQSSTGRHVPTQIPSRRVHSLTPSPPPRPVEYEPPSDVAAAGPSRRPQEPSRSLRSQASSSRRNNPNVRDTSSTGSSTLVPSTQSMDTSAAGLVSEWYERLPDDVALITIESPNGECPRLPREFHYLESSYLGEEDKEYEDGFFLSCECSDIDNTNSRLSCCTTAGGCSCLLDNGGVPAYDDNRRFTFASFDLVVECNEYCACDAATCTNRVAQLPRDVPLQIFRTDECGWGVRPTVRLERGKVIGVCTGQLIEREKAEQLQGPMKDYAWDLDFNERANEEPENRGQSILSYSCGNWTRFLNHACEPNLRTFPVLYDHPQIPKLAFVACKPVEPFEELLLDYRDMSGTRFSTNSPGLRARRGPGRPPKGSKTCKCGVPSCRGWY